MGVIDVRAIMGGNSDFKKVRERDGLYVDKSMLIEGILKETWEVILFTRPRRFGKTTNLSMIKYFFDIEEAAENRELFKGLKIEDTDSMKYFGKYPVIFLSLKDIKQSTKEESMNFFKELMYDLYSNYHYLKESLEISDKIYFENVLLRKENNLSMALRHLMKFLYEYHKKKVVVLIDEYDTPLITAYIKNYYDEVIDFYRVFFATAFKDNIYLEKSVITGINRIAREGIFSGLNNLKVCSVLSNDFGDCFGFTEEEVKELLVEYEMENTFNKVKHWYDGYNFGGYSIYNPWSMANYLSGAGFKSHWINSGDNELITQSLKNVATKDTFEDLEELFKGKTMKADIDEKIIFKDLETPEQLWNLMLNAGYLTCTGEIRERYKLRIPNFEIQRYFEKAFIDNFVHNRRKIRNIVDAIVEGDISEFETELKEHILASGSYIISDKENFYQGYMLGLFIVLKPYFYAKLEGETGFGRCDISLEAFDRKDMSYIIELKVAKDEKELKEITENAINQIKEKEYYTEFKAKKLENVTLIGITFCGKKVDFISETVNFEKDFK